MSDSTPQEVAPGVYAIGNRWAEGKSGVIIGRDRVLAIDANACPEETEAALAWLRRRGMRMPASVAYTHCHGDHILGSTPLRELDTAPVAISHDEGPNTLQRELTRLSERARTPAALLARELLVPSLTFSHTASLHLGDKKVQLIHAPGHSPDGVCAYCVEDGVLFGGDTVVTGIIPAIGDGDSRDLEDSLRRLAALSVEVLVPGHGPVVTGRARCNRWIVGWAAYLCGVREAVRRAIDSGVPTDQVAHRISFEVHVGDKLPADRHNMVGRHQATVERIVSEETSAVEGGGRP